MNKNSMKNLSSSSLSWNSGHKENAEIGINITQVISLYPPNDVVGITFTLDSSNVAFQNNNLQQWKATTNFDGEICVSIYSVTNTPCKFTLKAYCSGSPEISAPPLSLEFLPKNVNKIVLTVNKDNAQANGTDTDELTATVVDDDGHPKKGVTVDFTADNDAELIPSSRHTDEKGEIAITVTSKKSGEVKIWAIVQQKENDDNDKATHTIVHFKEDHRIELIAMKDNALPDGTDTAELTAKVTDYAGHPIKGVTVDFTADNGAQVSPSSGQTNKNGQIVITVISHSVGAVKVHATERDNGKKSDITVQFNYVYSINITDYPRYIPLDDKIYTVEGYLQANSKMNDTDISNKEINISIERYFCSTNQNNSAISNQQGHFVFGLSSNEYDSNIVFSDIENVDSSFTLSCSGSPDVKINITVGAQIRHNSHGGYPPVV
ncbi:Ig-like domain-containing protein [Xenorhabdus bovienii]|uniref:Ig-like domain-containing protein n=1 Tax=Xenorhabdus bovienii TaxID=40576 RepID=UPI0023B32388|nr:Ig-like domain-containing protein [Xenorhabdus bovienii]MDE9518061.1 Ig-like domain-containing protein [Xenorhabdus bovienii]